MPKTLANQSGRIKAQPLSFVRFYASKWRSGCFGLSFEQEGLYIRMCAYIYDTQDRVPLDDSVAAKFLGGHTNAYRKIRDQLAALGKIVRTADGWTVPKAEIEIRKALGAAWKSDGEELDDGGATLEGQPDALPDTLTVTQQVTPPEPLPDTQGVFSEKANEINGPIKTKYKGLKKEEDSPSSPPPTSVAKPKAAPRGARLQPDWALPSDWFDWTRINFAQATPDLIRLEAEKFADYWHAKSGQQASKLDWQATWRNWCRTAFASRPATVKNRPEFERQRDPYAITVPANTIRYAKPAPGSEWEPANA